MASKKFKEMMAVPREESLRQVRGSFDEEAKQRGVRPEQGKGVSDANKVAKALRATGNDGLADKIRDCRPRARCSSFYCSYCRERASKRLEGVVHRRIDGGMKGDEKIVQHRLRFLTVLNDVTKFELGSVQRAVEMGRADLNAFHRKFPNVWMRGAFEFELIDVRELLGNENRASTRKRKTIEKMLEDSLDGKLSGSGDGLRILVHFHAVVDIDDADESELKAWMRQRWSSHPNQVDFKKTFEGQALWEKVWKVSSYCFKNRFQFNDTVQARDYELGKVFTNNDLGRLIRLYQDFLDSTSGSFKGVQIWHG